MSKRPRKTLELIHRLFQEDPRRHVLFFSPVESDESVARQLLALESGAAVEDVDARPALPGVLAAAEVVRSWDLEIDTTPRPTLKDVLRKIQSAILRSPVDVIVFDAPAAIRNEKERSGK